MSQAPYRPVSCDVHDVLEATAIRRTRATIGFVDSDDAPTQVSARVVDIVTRSDREYVVLESGVEIRLDRVRSVDGVRPGDVPG